MRDTFSNGFKWHLLYTQAEPRMHSRKIPREFNFYMLVTHILWITQALEWRTRSLEGLSLLAYKQRYVHFLFLNTRAHDRTCKRVKILTTTTFNELLFEIIVIYKRAHSWEYTFTLFESVVTEPFAFTRFYISSGFLTLRTKVFWMKGLSLLNF